MISTQLDGKLKKILYSQKTINAFFKRRCFHTGIHVSVSGFARYQCKCGGESYGDICFTMFLDICLVSLLLFGKM